MQANQCNYYKQKKITMSEKERAEFRALIANFMQACSLYGTDQDKVIRGMMVIEDWVNDFADKRVFDTLKKDAKLKVVDPPKDRFL